MTRTLPMMEARSRLTQLPEEFERNPEAGAVTVTRRGKPVLAVIPWDLYDSIVETLEILGDPELMKTLRRGIQARKGRTYTTAEVRKALRL